MDICHLLLTPSLCLPDYFPPLLQEVEGEATVMITAAAEEEEGEFSNL